MKNMIADWTHTLGFLRSMENTLAPFLIASAPYKNLPDDGSQPEARAYSKSLNQYASIIETAAAKLMALSRNRVDMIASKNCDAWISVLRKCSDLIAECIEIQEEAFATCATRQEWGGDNFIGHWMQKTLGVKPTLDKREMQIRRRWLAFQRKDQKIERDLAELQRRADGVGKTLKEKYAEFRRTLGA